MLSLQALPCIWFVRVACHVGRGAALGQLFIEVRANGRVFLCKLYLRPAGVLVAGTDVPSEARVAIAQHQISGWAPRCN